MPPTLRRRSAGSGSMSTCPRSARTASAPWSVGSASWRRARCSKPENREAAMTTILQTLLGERDWLLADGATGTNLFNLGLEAGEAPELWNEAEPDRIRALYDGAIAAGSDLFLTNSFGGNASRLKLHDADGRVAEINRRGGRDRSRGGRGRRPAGGGGRLDGADRRDHGAARHAQHRERRADVRGAGPGSARRRRGCALGRDHLGARGVPGGGARHRPDRRPTGAAR